MLDRKQLDMRMHIKPSLALGALLLVMLASSDPARAQGAMWTGYYVGVQAGGAWASGDTNIGCVDTGAPVCAPGIAAGSFVTGLSSNLSGFIGGGQAGYNFQYGHWVLGLEGDFSGTSLDGSASRPTVAGPLTLLTTVSQSLEWLSTVRGRVGITTHNWLFYATGGLAFGNVKQSFTNTVSNGDSAIASDSNVETGWTVGGGAEYGFGHWSLRGEYLYYDLGDQRLNAPGVLAGGGPSGLAFQPNFENKGQIVRAGANLFFN